MKRLIVIADVHSNYMALKSAVNTIDKIKPDGIIFLGDYVTDFPYTQRTMKLIYDLKNRYKCWFIKGNREEYLLEHRQNLNDGWCKSSSVGSLLYTYENLTEKDLNFFDSLPICREIKIDDTPLITICHGSPYNTKDNLLTDTALLKKCLSNMKSNILLCGHTHKRKIISDGNKKIILCSSLGLPQNNEKYGHTEMLMLSLDENIWQEEFIDIEFDADTLIDDYRKSELPEYAPVFSECIIKSLKTNRDIAYECVVSAWNYAKDDNYKGGKILPEKYWNKAAKELKII